MSERKHTPGPWETADEGNEIKIIALTREAWVEVATVDGISETGIADAALITAAPDLFEACQEIVHGFAEVDGKGTFTYRVKRDVALKTIAALEKAKGENAGQGS